MDVLEKWALKAESRKLYMRNYMNAYYVTHKEVILANQLRSNIENREKIRIRNRAWYAKNHSGKN